MEYLHIYDLGASPHAARSSTDKFARIGNAARLRGAYCWWAMRVKEGAGAGYRRAAGLLRIGSTFT